MCAGVGASGVEGYGGEGAAVREPVRRFWAAGGCGGEVMTTYQELIRAFEIFGKYEFPQGVQAEHDEMWAGPDADTVSAEDVAELETLGWTPAEEGGFHHFT